MRGVTHGGPFQADDLLAFLILRVLYGIELLRSYDREVIANAEFAWDVGGVYDHALRRYDHHQTEGLAQRRRENGVPRAALGLIWLHYGEAFVSPYAARYGVSASLLWRQIDATIIQGLDAADCGERGGGFALCHDAAVELRVQTLSEQVLCLNPAPPLEDTSEASYLAAFLRGADVIWPLFERMIVTEAAKLHAEGALARYDGEEILVLDQIYLWEDAVSGTKSNAKFVVFPLKPDRWAVQAVAVKPGSQQTRRKLPFAWAGLAGDALRGLTGVPTAIAVGVSLYRATASSREGAIRLAELAIACK